LLLYHASKFPNCANTSVAASAGECCSVSTTPSGWSGGSNALPTPGGGIDIFGIALAAGSQRTLDIDFGKPFALVTRRLSVGAAMGSSRNQHVDAVATTVSMGSSWKNWKTRPMVRPRQPASCASLSV
jgi:hypothetical protein